MKWADLFKQKDAKEDDGVVRKATSGQHSSVALGGLLDVVGEEETPAQLASLEELGRNVSLSAVDRIRVGEFVISPQGGNLPVGVTNDIREVRPSGMPLVLLLIVAASVTGLVAQVVADSHAGRHFGEFNRDVYIEFEYVHFPGGREAQAMVVVKNSYLHVHALEFQAYAIEEKKRKERSAAPSQSSATASSAAKKR